MKIIQICSYNISLRGEPGMLSFSFHVVSGETKLSSLLFGYAKEVLTGTDLQKKGILEEGWEKVLQDFVSWSMQETNNAIGTWFREIEVVGGEFSLDYGSDVEASGGDRGLADEFLRFLKQGCSADYSEDFPHSGVPWLMEDSDREAWKKSPQHRAWGWLT